MAWNERISASVKWHDYWEVADENGFDSYAEAIREIVTGKYGCSDLPILYGINFGHTSPICVLPYDAEAEIDVENLRFTILESGVVW